MPKSNQHSEQPGGLDSTAGSPVHYSWYILCTFHPCLFLLQNKVNGSGSVQERKTAQFTKEEEKQLSSCDRSDGRGTGRRAAPSAPRGSRRRPGATAGRQSCAIGADPRGLYQGSSEIVLAATGSGEPLFHIFTFFLFS